MTAPANRGKVEPSCPTCGGRVWVYPPKSECGGDVRAWARALRSPESPRDGVTDAQTYATRRQAQRRAARYRQQLAERGLKTESVTRPRYRYYGRWGWQFVLWRYGERPGPVVERAVAEKERVKAERDAKNRRYW